MTESQKNMHCKDGQLYSKTHLKLNYFVFFTHHKHRGDVPSTLTRILVELNTHTSDFVLGVESEALP